MSKVLHAVSSSVDTSQATDASFSWSKSRPPSQEASPSVEGTSHTESSTDSGYINSFTSPGEASRAKLGFSQASAFVPVKSLPKSEPNEDADRIEMPDDGENQGSIVRQITGLSEVLSEIVSMANILEKASELSLQDLKGDK